MSLQTLDANTHDAIAEALDAAGWAIAGEYEADGPDGTIFARVSPEALCVVHAYWGGGDDDDTTYVASGEYLQLECVPRPLTHSDRRRNPR
jgi:hypothetical protein